MEEKNYFDENGHLTEYAFNSLINGTADELKRLEISEHLSFCDLCLDIYMERMEQIELISPSSFCEASLMKKIKERALKAIYNKYATMAVAASFAMALWVGGVFNIDYSEFREFQQKARIEENRDFVDRLEIEIGNKIEKFKEVLVHGEEK